MESKQVPHLLRQLAAAGLLLFSFQSCTKQEELKPSSNATTSASTQGTNALTNYCKQVCLVAGQHTYVGAVNVAMDGNDVLVTYNLTSSNVFLQEIHVEAFTSLDDLRNAKKLNNGGAIPGKFTYKQSFSGASRTTTATIRLKASELPQSTGEGQCFFIATHAALSNGETAWGGICDEGPKGVKLDDTKQFPGNNWGAYFEFCKKECSETIDFTYAWEDLKASNDRDYNDLVVQSKVTKSFTEMKINFLATARGAAYDHSFKFRIPMAGINAVFGSDPNFPVTDDGTYYYVTVFGSTKKVLPEKNGIYANTQAGAACTPFATASVTLTLKPGFVYNKAKPYEPFIRVWPSKTVGTGEFYDLYIYEVSGPGSTNTYEYNGELYPNGILIPLDWRWPLEQTSITLPYPRFTSISAGFTPDWYTPLADPSKTFNKAACQ
ncbi:LruC domain-containing protein [Hymenobacter sp. GOD-10R]|uniref:LruC domain-containing protein n=1 Tax=Hymenobacter sp. GOD-10R TaxID=3093922 RepID=UPI002D77592B|nr:LruC domain-containing protein [Hymenobacter sp. GOD-10R]WRQ30175.1 LruC domain-containing protein [Hymenobacter sp. GOD-10R]